MQLRAGSLTGADVEGAGLAAGAALVVAAGLEVLAGAAGADELRNAKALPTAIATTASTLRVAAIVLRRV